MARVGKNIKKIRSKKNMTQDELAEKLFVTRQTISNWETERSRPGIEELVQLAAAMDTTTDVLIYGEERVLPATDVVVYSKKRVIITDIALIVLGIVLFILLLKARDYARRYYDLSPVLLLQIAVFPVYWMLCGWNIMQTLGVLGVARHHEFKYRKIWRGLVVSVLVIYGILALPMAVELIYSSLQKWQMMRNAKGGWSWSYSYLAYYPEPLQTVTWQILWFVSRWHTLFLIPGVLLWMLKREGKKEDEKIK